MSEQLTYVCYARCGHVNAFVAVPAIDDVEERATLINWLRYYIKTGRVECVGLDAMRAIKLDMCKCDDLARAIAMHEEKQR